MDPIVEAGLRSLFNSIKGNKVILPKEEYDNKHAQDGDGAIGVDEIFHQVCSSFKEKEQILAKEQKGTSSIEMTPKNTFELVIKIWSCGKELRITLPTNATVDDLKQRINECEDVLKHQKHEIYFSGLAISDYLAINEYHLNQLDGQVLLLYYETTKLEYIFLKSLKTYTYYLPLSTTVEEFKTMVMQREGHPVKEQCVTYAGKVLQDDRSLQDYNIKKESLIHFVLRMRGGGLKFFYADPDCFAKEHNYDFTNCQADDAQYERGGKPYKRPIGSKRYALKVWDRYEDNQWLGESESDFDFERTHSTPGEWPVAYHGTHEKNVESIAKEGLRLANGKRFLYGRGIYCTPDPKTALAYGHEYEHEGSMWKLILQLRVKPDNVKIVDKSQTPPGFDEYWVLEEDGDLRPYGVCVYPMSSRSPPRTRDETNGKGRCCIL